MFKHYFLVLSLTFSFNISADVLNLWSESAILIDFDTEQILFEKNKEEPIPPASMTKLVTLYMTYKEMDNRKITYNDIVPISKNADYKNLPRDSSLMFIEEGQIVTLYELMLGLAIPSGNDAAIAIAEYLFGSVEDYIKSVNKEMKDLGLIDLYFVDSSGFNDENSITTQQFVEFTLILLKKYPQVLDLFSKESYTYPQKSNGYSTIGSIKQYNHNQVINLYQGCDGLKTGFINKSGMNITLTATKNDRRVVAVLAGVKDSDKKQAELKRLKDSITILDFGLNNFININLDKIELPLLKINTQSQYIKPIIPYKILFTLNKQSTFEYILNIVPIPVDIEGSIGSVILNQDGIYFDFPIYINY